MRSDRPKGTHFTFKTYLNSTDTHSGAGAETGAGAGTGATSTWRVRSAITANEEPRGGAGGGGGAGDALIDSDITPALTEPTDVTSSLIVTCKTNLEFKPGPVRTA